jgi:NadR type nicotinamide-nucleotide adenylyltransferase
MNKIGLFLGKFTIFHAGHQLVIDTALSEMDHVIVLIYDAPSSTTIPLDVRAGWIEKIYASKPVTVMKGWAGPEDTGYTEKIKTIQDKYILKMVGDKGITHFYSSEPYGEHVSKALQCANRMVDLHRTIKPIAASKIQSNPFAFRKFIYPLVYADLITKIVFVGAPSTGKTSLAEKMAEEFQTEWMPEYGREYWDKHQKDRRLEPWQLTEIAEGHIVREDEKVRNANKYLFVDTNAVTTFMFGLDYHGFVEPRLAELANCAFFRYDLVFLCGDEMPYDDTWDRSGDAKRHEFQRQIEADLLRRKTPYISLSGILVERVSKVKHILASFDKWLSLGNFVMKTEIK